MSSGTFRDLFFEVVGQANANLVLNADDGAGGVGATVTVPGGALGGDGVLAPEESFTQPFEIGLATGSSVGEGAPFRFEDGLPEESPPLHELYLPWLVEWSAGEERTRESRLRLPIILR